MENMKNKDKIHSFLGQDWGLYLVNQLHIFIFKITEKIGQF